MAQKQKKNDAIKTKEEYEKAVNESSHYKLAALNVRLNTIQHSPQNNPRNIREPMLVRVTQGMEHTLESCTRGGYPNALFRNNQARSKSDLVDDWQRVVSIVRRSRRKENSTLCPGLNIP